MHASDQDLVDLDAHDGLLDEMSMVRMLGAPRAGLQRLMHTAASARPGKPCEHVSAYFRKSLQIVLVSVSACAGDRWLREASLWPFG